MTLGNLLDLCGPQLSHLQTGDNNGTHLPALFSGTNESVQVKQLRINRVSTQQALERMSCFGGGSKDGDGRGSGTDVTCSGDTARIWIQANIPARLRPDMEQNLPKLAKQNSPDSLFYALCTKLSLSQGRGLFWGAPLALPFKRAAEGGTRRGTPRPPLSLSTRQAPPIPVSPGVLHSSGWKGSKQQVKSENPQHFLHNSLCSCGRRHACSRTFQVVGNRKRDLFMALPLCLRHSVQSAIISIAFAICQTGFPGKNN